MHLLGPKLHFLNLEILPKNSHKKLFCILVRACIENAAVGAWVPVELHCGTGFGGPRYLGLDSIAG